MEGVYPPLYLIRGYIVMAYTHFKKLSGIDGLAMGKKGEEIEIGNFPILETSGTVKACLTNGLTIVTGGTGISDLTIGAPVKGARARIRLNTLSSGSVIVTAVSGVTLDGTNNTATFDTAQETLELIYAGENKWAVALNIGVALSSV
jgi:hypothetical protein